MDDKKFDELSAFEWMRTIEGPRANIREKDIYPLLKSWLSACSSKNVLDIGCGQGVCSAHVGEEIEYTGIDPSRELINRAHELYAAPSRVFVDGNAYELPFADKRFGAVISVAVWHLLSDLSRATKELSRVLKDHGAFLIITADPNNYQAWMERYSDQSIKGRQFVGINRTFDGSVSSDTMYLYSLDEIVQTLEKWNLQVSSVVVIRSFVAISGVKR
jgi:ubiquinone/menaquinone biosynthesis C-methylase UbiE